jgi:hemoglobin
MVSTTNVSGRNEDKHVSMGALNSSNNSQKDALMEKLGGKDRLHVAVDQFYDKLASDQVLYPFFKNSDVQLLKWHQFNFMSIAFSEVPESFDVEELILKKHARFFDIGMNTEHFDLVLRHFESTLTELGISSDIVKDALAMLVSLRSVFERGVAEATSRQRAARRNHYIYITMVAAIVSAIAVQGAMRHRRRRG